MSFVIYKIEQYEGADIRWYLTSVPHEDNPLSGFGYRGSTDGVIPEQAGTIPTEFEASRICEYLRTACYGPPEDHFYEPAP